MYDTLIINELTAYLHYRVILNKSLANAKQFRIAQKPTLGLREYHLDLQDILGCSSSTSRPYKSITVNRLNRSSW